MGENKIKELQRWHDEAMDIKEIEKYEKFISSIKTELASKKINRATKFVYELLYKNLKKGCIDSGFVFYELLNLGINDDKFKNCRHIKLYYDEIKSKKSKYLSNNIRVIFVEDKIIKVKGVCQGIQFNNYIADFFNEMVMKDFNSNEDDHLDNMYAILFDVELLKKLCEEDGFELEYGRVLRNYNGIHIFEIPYIEYFGYLTVPIETKEKNIQRKR